MLLGMSDLTLEIVEGPDAGRQIPIRGPLVLGRDHESDVMLGDAQVSRRHVEVVPDGDALRIADLGSANGTIAGGAEVAGSGWLTPGQELQVGVTVMLLRTGGEIAAQPTALHAVPPGLRVEPREPSYVPPTGESVQARYEGPSELHQLKDVNVRAAANTAPLAILALVALAVIVYLAVS